MRQTNLPYDRTAHGKLLTVLRVSEMLECSKSFVYNLIKLKELAYVRLGSVKGMRVPEKSVRLYIRKKEAAARNRMEP